MSGYIYLIINQINQKKYIGQTRRTIQQRYKEHLKLASSDDKRHLYRAMRKYGVNNFTIQELEKVEDNTDLDSREQYWIAYYDTYRAGYNETLGGEGYLQYDYNIIYRYYIEHQRNTTETAQHFNCDISVVLNARRNNQDNPSDYFISDATEQKILEEIASGMTNQDIAAKFHIHSDSVVRIKRKHGIKRYTYQLKKQAKKIIATEKATGIKYSFDSIREAARWLGNINYNQNIGACLHNRQKTAYGYTWQYQEKANNAEESGCL